MASGDAAVGQPGAQVVLQGHSGCRVVIEVLADEGHDWVSCRVTIAIGEFTATYPASFELRAFRVFQEQLKAAYSTLTGTASFEPRERTLDLEVEMLPTGRTVIRGVARRFSPDLEFAFEFGGDQTFLGPVCRDLEAILS